MLNRGVFLHMDKLDWLSDFFLSSSECSYVLACLHERKKAQNVLGSQCGLSGSGRACLGQVAAGSDVWPGARARSTLFAALIICSDRVMVFLTN